MMNGQIEEMAEVLENAKIDARATIGSMNNGFGVWYAQALYNAGYRKHSEWISVEDRLPEDTLPADYKQKTIKVFVAIKGKNGVTIRTQKRFLDYTYKDGERISYWTWRFSAGKVTHWMPLPEPPKGGG